MWGISASPYAKGYRKKQINTYNVLPKDGTSSCAVLCLVTQSDSVTPWTLACQAPLSMGILQARILEWLTCPPPGDLPNPGIKPRFPILQVDSLSSEPPKKSKNIGVGCLMLLQGNSLMQELNQGLLHCRQILYQLSYQGSPTLVGWNDYINKKHLWYLKGMDLWKPPAILQC